MSSVNVKAKEMCSLKPTAERANGSPSGWEEIGSVGVIYVLLANLVQSAGRMEIGHMQAERALDNTQPCHMSLKHLSEFQLKI